MKKFFDFENMFLIVATFAISFLVSCKSDDPPAPATTGTDPVAAFTSKASGLKVTFTNTSKNATSYAWNFGVEGATSTDKDPTYTYSKAGTFKVTLTAKNDKGTTNEFSANVTVAEIPDDPAMLLYGSESKVWYLLADVSKGKYPYKIAPADESQLWWALGSNVQLCERECIFDDTWTFKKDGTYKFNNNGDYYGEGGIWKQSVSDDGCFDATVSTNWTMGSEGQDLSGWNSGEHKYAYDAEKKTLTVTGGFIGIPKATPSGEVKKPAASVVYEVKKLDVSGDVDTLILRVTFTNDTNVRAYWESVLVSYNNANMKVTVNECPPVDTSAPTTAAPTPTARTAGDVISLFSGAYTDVTVGNWKADWSSATYDEVMIANNATKKYTSLNVVGIEPGAGNLLDITNMSHVSFDLWTPNAATFKIKLVDFGANATYQGGDDTEHEITVTTLNQNQWNHYDIPLTDFTGLTTKANVAQLIFAATPSGMATAYIDNIYFYRGTIAPATAPTTAAPTPPARDAANVISIYGGTPYTNITGVTYDPDWGQAGHGMVNTSYNPGDGNSALAYVNFNYQGTTFTAKDASMMDSLHVDIWVPSGTNRKVKVTPVNASTGTGVAEVLVEVPLTPGAWNSVNLSKNQFTGMTWDAVHQLKFDGQFNGDNSANTTTRDPIYLDNIYFSKTTTKSNHYHVMKLVSRQGDKLFFTSLK